MVMHMGFEVDNVTVEHVFLRALRISPAIYPPINVSYSSTIQGWYSRPILGRSTNGLSLTAPSPPKKKTALESCSRGFFPSLIGNDKGKVKVVPVLN
jgi:hypothetical protein